MRRWIVPLAFVAALAVLGLGYILGRRGAEPPAAGSGRRIFVSNYKSDTVSVVDERLAREIATLPVGDSPDGIAVRRERPLVAVANGTGARVTLIDPVSLQILGSVAVGGAPEDVAFGADGRLFVASTEDKVVNVIDPDARTALGPPIAFTDKPRRLATSPDGKRLYVLLSAEHGSVAVVDTASGAITDRLQIGGTLRGLGVSGDGRYLLVERFDNDTITVVDTVSMLPTATRSVTTGHGIVVHPRRPIVYSMASFDDHTYAIDYDTGAQLADWSYGQWPTYSAITADGHYLYIVHEESDNIAQVDTETNQLVAKIAVGAQPSAAAIFEPR